MDFGRTAISQASGGRRRGGWGREEGGKCIFVLILLLKCFSSNFCLQHLPIQTPLQLPTCSICSLVKVPLVDSEQIVVGYRLAETWGWCLGRGRVVSLPVTKYPPRAEAGVTSLLFWLLYKAQTLIRNTTCRQAWRVKTICCFLMALYFKPPSRMQRFVFASRKPSKEVARKRHRGTRSSNPLML